MHFERAGNATAMAAEEANSMLAGVVQANRQLQHRCDSLSQDNQTLAKHVRDLKSSFVAGKSPRKTSIPLIILRLLT